MFGVDGRVTGIVLFLGGGFLELNSTDPPRERGRTPMTLWLQVPDVDAERDRLAATGDVVIVSEPKTMPWGLREMWIEDPDGVRIVLVEVPEDHPIRNRLDFVAATGEKSTAGNLSFVHRVGDGSQTVLVVDDDASVRAMLGYLLHDEGYTVTEAADGAEAIAELTAAAPDCMILDLMMPNVDGLDVLRARRERGFAPDTRVLVLTAKTDTKDAVWCWELGADEYLNKPVDPDKLAREIRQLLSRTSNELQRRRRVGRADARERDKLEAAFTPKDAR